MSGHPYHQPQDGRRQQHHHMQQHQQPQQPQYYGQQQPYYGEGAQFVHGMHHVHQQQQQQQQQQHDAYGHGYSYPQHQHQQHQHHQPPPPLPPQEEDLADLAVIEAEIRSVVESALSTPSLLRGAGAASGNGSGGYNHKSHHKRQHKQQQQPALLEKFSGGGVAVDEVCRLPQVKRLAQGDKALVLRALEASELLVLAGAGKQQRVGRKDSGADLPYRCVVLTRLPGDKANEAAVRGMVAPYGEVGCVVVLGGGAAEEEGEKDAGAGEGEREATAAGRGPPMLEAKAMVEFVEGKAAVKCVEALSRGSNWRRGSRAEFACGVSLAQAAKHFGVELGGGGSGGESGASANGGGGESGSSTAAAASASSAAAAMPASVLEARLPPTFSEGTHTGVVMEMEMALVSTDQPQPQPSAEGGATAVVQRGVIKREGRVRSQISFELPAAEVPADVAVGARVDFVVRHVEGRACIVGVAISTAPPPAAPLRFTNSKKKEAAGGGAAPFVQAKGPDERGGVGFLLPRTKPSEEMRGLLLSMKQLKVAAKSG